MLRTFKHMLRVPHHILRISSSIFQTLLLDTTKGQRRISITSGATQGSILGPDLWNVSYNGLLRLKMPDEIRLVGYAEDVAALAAGRNAEEAELKLGVVMLLHRAV